MQQRFLLSFFCLILLSLTIAQEPLDNESADTPKSDPIFVDVEEAEAPADTEGRALLGYPKIRISANYELIMNGTGTSEWKTYVTKQLIPGIVSYFEGALSIKSPILSPIKTTATTLCGFPTPSALTEGVSNADIVIFFNSAYDTSSSWMGATTLCALSSGVKKPLIVNIGLNTHTLGTASISTPLDHDLYVTTIAHEFFHAFGMNSAYFKYFIDSSGNPLTNFQKTMTINGYSRTVLDLPPLTARLRTFYGCSSTPGVVMENQGGTHLERRYFQYEIMSSGDMLGTKISEVSLGFLEGTGWYIPDYSYAEPYSFGQGEGCGFINNACDANEFAHEYCAGSGNGCNAVGQSGGYCASDSKSEGCRFYISQRSLNCENPAGVSYSPLGTKQVYGRGLGSKCFTGNISASSTSTKNYTYCFTYNCVGSGSDTILEVNFGTNTLTCEKKGPLDVAGYHGSIDCPDPVAFCKTIGKPTCPRNCMGRGTCTNGKCKCKSGFQGTDCAFTD